jgi:hypothetical protein
MTKDNFYTLKHNAKRAAVAFFKKNKGLDALLDEHFTLTEGNGGWTWVAIVPKAATPPPRRRQRVSGKRKRPQPSPHRRTGLRQWLR